MSIADKKTVHGYPILARKPRQAGYGTEAEVILVDRGEGSSQRYVTAVFTPLTAQHDEWLWGHYFSDYDRAVADFNVRP